MSEPDWLDNLILIAAGVSYLIVLLGYARRAWRWLVWFARPDDDDLSPMLPSQLPPEPSPSPFPSQPVPALATLAVSSSISFWSPTLDIALPVLAHDAQRNWLPSLETYKRLVKTALDNRGGMLAVPPAYVEELIVWFREAYEAGRLAPDRETALRPDGPTWLLVVAYPKR